MARDCVGRFRKDRLLKTTGRLATARDASVPRKADGGSHSIRIDDHAGK